MQCDHSRSQERSTVNRVVWDSVASFEGEARSGGFLEIVIVLLFTLSKARSTRPIVNKGGTADANEASVLFFFSFSVSRFVSPEVKRKKRTRSAVFILLLSRFFFLFLWLIVSGSAMYQTGFENQIPHVLIQIPISISFRLVSKYIIAIFSTGTRQGGLPPLSRSQVCIYNHVKRT